MQTKSKQFLKSYSNFHVTAFQNADVSENEKRAQKLYKLIQIDTEKSSKFFEHEVNRTNTPTTYHRKHKIELPQISCRSSSVNLKQIPTAPSPSYCILSKSLKGLLK
ncbi:Hypothetical_protein [Hexamita inflata]|uniref:Hypothetical_protein n=1 Tax=Hexamita inflata TaxID=28002 RepID=A0AA86QEZ6_9EUKA|nr:Hypothetical protein HINF_LOCUS42672 [Hexamita inflata]